MDEDKSMGSESEMIPNTKEQKEQYVKPELTVHGTVHELTGLLGSDPTDGVLGSRLV